MAVSTATNYYVLALNPNTTASTLSLTFPDTVCGTLGYRTSATEDFTQVPAATRNGTIWSLALKATSLTTYIFTRGNACTVHV